MDSSVIMSRITKEHLSSLCTIWIELSTFKEMKFCAYDFAFIVQIDTQQYSKIYYVQIDT